MKIQNRLSCFLLQILFVGFLICFSSKTIFAQVQVGVTVNSGNSTTTCGDFIGTPLPLWEVRVGTGAWVIYSNTNNNNCFSTYPNLQWAFPFDCPQDLPTTLNICFKAYEKDGFGACNVTPDCEEEICQNFAVPTPGNIANYTLSLPAGGESEGEVDFSIGALGTNFNSTNDEICNAENMGTLNSGATLGIASAGGFDNICASNTNDPSPSDDGVWINEKGVWFEFTTSNQPGYEIEINSLNDPLGLGNDINLEMAVYESDDGTCSGALTMVEASFDLTTFNDQLILYCAEPNTTYYILVDGNDFSLENEGHFGIEIIDNGVMAGGELRCDAYDFGMIPTGGSASVSNVHNECANAVGDPNPSAFITQQSVWFSFTAPPSGSVQIDVLSVDGPPNNNGIGAQIAVYRSFNNMCTGFFFEVGSVFTSADNDETLSLECLDPGDSYWILVDGSGSNTAGIFDVVVTDLENYPPETTIDTMVCFGGSIEVGNSTYDETGNYTYVFSLPNGCDSTVLINLVVADSLEVEAVAVTLASAATAADGSVSANPTGGIGPFSYMWNNGAITQLNDNIPSGIYCVTVTDDIGCEAEDCVELDFSPISATANGDVLDCFGDEDGTISFSAQDGQPPYNYSYTNGDATITGSGVITIDGDLILINNLPAGDYQIDFEDANLVTTLVIASITEPIEITNNQDYTLCFGETVQVGTTTYSASGNILETLTATNGCDSIVSGVLTILPDPSTSLDTMICFGNDISIASSNYSATGIYQDTLMNSEGCDSIITTNLTVLDEIMVTIDVTTLPSGYNQTEGFATAQAAGGAGGFSYAWSNSQSAATATNLAGGTQYCVTVTDANNCNQEACTTVLYQPNIAIALNDTLDCFGGTDGVITLAVANGLGNYNYTWENIENGMIGSGLITGNIGSANLSNLGKGQYNITVTDTYVSTTISVNVIEPSLLEAQSLTAQNVSCVGSCDGATTIDVTGGTGTYSYSWSGGIASVPDPTNLCALTYTVTVTDEKGCTATVVIDMPEPVAFSASIAELNSISCGGESDGSLMVTPTGGTGDNYIYAWSNNSVQSLNENLSTGNYAVTISDEVGCTVVENYSLNEPTPVDFDLNITDVNCWNGLNSGSVLLGNISGGTEPYVYALGQGDYSTSPNFPALISGSYQVYVQDANGCEYNDVAIVNLPDLVEVSLGDDREIFLGETVEIQAQNNTINGLIEWNVDSCQNCPSFEVTPLFTTVYEVNVLDTITGCSDIDSVWIYVSKERKIFIPNAFSPNADGANDYMTIFADLRSVQDISNFRVFNRWGALVFERDNLMPNVETEGWDGYFNGKKMQSGVYIYSVEIEFIDGEVELFKGEFTLME